MGGTKGAQVLALLREDDKGLGLGDCRRVVKTQRGPAIKAPNFKGEQTSIIFNLVFASSTIANKNL
ncbi:hypothetical protein H8957_001097, partial [Semnopithecus entellus]